MATEQRLRWCWVASDVVLGNVWAMRPATTLTLGLLLAAILIAGIVALLRL